MLSEFVLKNLNQLGLAAIYFVFGLVMLFLGRLVWELVTKYKINKELAETDNVAAGITEFGFLIALSIIIIASVKGEVIGTIPIHIDLIVSFMYAIFGLIALAVSKFVLELVSPFNLDDEISRDRNPAVGWFQAGFYIAIAIIIYGVL